MRVAVSTTTRTGTDLEALRQLRFRAARALQDIPYEPAAISLVRHLNLTFQDYERGVVAKTWLLEAIAALGSTGSETAAVRLADFLDLLNSFTEDDRPYDMQVTLAVVTNLERLGFAVAYDSLFYVTLLDYPQSVKDAARSAMDAVSQ
jgi:HEAT repeat protein